MITLHDVSVAYGAATALEETSATFDASTCVALIGPNGSGKTTLLKVIAGLIRPSDGHIHREGTPSVAYLAQHHDQHPWMPLAVSEVLAMSRYRRTGLFRRLNGDDRSAIDAAAERMEVTGLVDAAFGSLSGGQRQRVLMASVLADDADVVLLDEPITGLDLASQRRILDVMDEERSRGRLVMISTHHLEEARRCDRVLLLAGRVVADGPPDTTLTADALAEAFGDRVVTDDPEHPVVIDEHGHGHARTTKSATERIEPR